eukprot:5579479-Prymnesium_polylepis.1
MAARRPARRLRQSERLVKAREEEVVVANGLLRELFHHDSLACGAVRAEDPAQENNVQEAVVSVAPRALGTAEPLVVEAVANR